MMSTTETTGDDWVKAAMSDDAVVVDLLVNLLRHQNSTPPPPRRLNAVWSLRQRRSRPSTSSSAQRDKKPVAAQRYRGSPTTPLSWSAGSDDSIRPTQPHNNIKLSDATRSKINAKNEKVALKRSRKKKTLVELKDEECSLLKERRELKEKMAALRMKLERQKVHNENLKRMKIQLILPREETASCQFGQKTTVSHHPIPISNIHDKDDDTYDSDSSKFFVPDLNLLPFVDSLGSDITYGLR